MKCFRKTPNKSILTPLKGVFARYGIDGYAFIHRIPKLVKYDVLCGIWHRWQQYCIIPVVILFVCGNFRQSLFVADGDKPTMMNYLFSLFEGRDVFDPQAEEKFQFPVVWLLIFLYFAYLSLEYPFQSLSGQCTQIMLRVKTRNVWWISKCIWVFISTILSFGLLYLSVWIFCVVSKTDISFRYAEWINDELLDMNLEALKASQLFALLFLLPIMTSLCVNMIQLCLGLFVKRIYSFLITAFVLCASCYFQFPFAVGTYAMVKRSVYCEGGQVSIWQGCFGNIILTLLVVAIGFWRFNRFDILREE